MRRAGSICADVLKVLATSRCETALRQLSDGGIAAKMVKYMATG